MPSTRKTKSALEAAMPIGTTAGTSVQDIHDLGHSARAHTALSGPLAFDDVGDGFEPGDLWVRTDTDEAWVCADNTSAAAVWLQVGGLSDPTWTNATLLNSWALHSDWTGDDVQYTKSRGVVMLRGLVDSGAVNTVMLTLPTGYRPVTMEEYLVPTVASDSTLVVGLIEIQGDGDVVFRAGETTRVSLSGVSFKAA